MDWKSESIQEMINRLGLKKIKETARIENLVTLLENELSEELCFLSWPDHYERTKKSPDISFYLKEKEQRINIELTAIVMSTSHIRNRKVWGGFF